ncbi:peptidogalycan biosysnthesis protein [Lysobacter enzymogenes]|uniref:peptidogalycan biosysnthesis protein n=1 Tax=Lysobacter enzymogenes TaxID=69 RepID=UPI00384C0705
MSFVTRLEPERLLGHFLAHPPAGFAAEMAGGGLPAFTAPFDPLTTAEPELLRRVRGWPGHALWRPRLRLRTRFIGATNTEYLWLPPLPGRNDAAALARRLREEQGRRCPLLIVKDLPVDSPLLPAEANRQAAAFADALAAEGFVLLEGQALAWVPIDFDSIDAYLARLSRGRRRDLRRKLRSRADLSVDTLAAGAPEFADDALVDAFYALYLNVYAQSEIHFDLLSRDYFRALLRDGDSGGVVFVYRHHGEMIGWNLCYEHAGMLVDKYIGLLYPQAREHNLYALSWFENLDYALRRNLDAYVAGWTDPQVKRQLGARFAFTRHAVYARNPLLRAGLRRMAKFFESDRSVLEAAAAAANEPENADAASRA